MVWLVLALFAGLAAVLVYDFLEGEWLIVDVIDETLLARASIARLDARWAANSRRSDVIVSLTTIPSRLPFLVDTLKSLLRQTKAPAKIQLAVPRFSTREQTEYRLPAWIKELRSVEIVECDRDWGPATKVIPALGAFSPDQKILVVDDDRIYAPRMIEILDKAATDAPDATYGLSGWVAPADLIDRPTTLSSNLFQRPPAPIRATRLSRPREVDILQGMSGYMVRPRFFDLAALRDYANAPPAAYFVDDVWIAAHCQVPKFVVPASRANFPPKRHAALFKRTSLGLGNRGGGDVEKRNNTIMLKYFAGQWRARAVRSSQMDASH